MASPQPAPAKAPQPPSDPRDPASDLPPDAPESLREAARGKDVDAQGEKDAVAWLLSAQRAPRYEVPVDFDTPDGTKKLVFVIRALDGKTIDGIEKRNTDQQSGPFGEMNDLRVNVEMVTEATVEIRDLESGHSVDPKGDEFRTEPGGRVLGDPADAMEQRFFYQSGLLTGLTTQIRRISGWAPDRVGNAERVVVEAAGNS